MPCNEAATRREILTVFRLLLLQGQAQVCCVWRARTAPEGRRADFPELLDASPERELCFTCIPSRCYSKYQSTGTEKIVHGCAGVNFVTFGGVSVKGSLGIQVCTISKVYLPTCHSSSAFRANCFSSTR